MLTEHPQGIPADADALVFTSPAGGPHRHDNCRKRTSSPPSVGATARTAEQPSSSRPSAGPGGVCGSDDPRYVLPTAKHRLPTAKHRLRFHDLRHTCATMLIAGGAPALAIRDHLGHQDLRRP